jgi:hypothetical protein
MISSPPASSVGRHRLGFALIISLLIHLSLVIGLGESSPFMSNSTMWPMAGLHAHLQPPVLPSHGLVPLHHHSESSSAAEQVIPAHFIIEPDLDALRDISVSIGGKIHFRLYVSSIGTVTSIKILQQDPVSLDLLDALKTRLEQARLYPAKRGGQAVDSTLDITVRFEPVTVWQR